MVKERRKSIPLSTRVDKKTKEIILKIAEKEDKYPSTVVSEAIERHLERMGWRIPVENIQFGSTQHYAIIAPTEHGKTVLVKEYVIPLFQGKKRILVVDKHQEYPFDSLPVEMYDTLSAGSSETLRLTENLMLKPKIDEMCKSIIDTLKNKNENIAIHPAIPDIGVQNIFFTEFFKRLCMIRWNPKLLMIVEEAQYYDCRSLISVARHYNIQTFLISTQPLDTTVMDNCKLILGPVSPFGLMMHNVDDIGVSAVGALEQFEFLWEKQKAMWRKMHFIPSWQRKT